MLTLIKYLWALPNTLLGLLFLLGGGAILVDGVIEIQNRLTRFILRKFPITNGAAALTLGHVVIGLDQQALFETRAHERVHVRQYERWGPFFLPAYLLTSLWVWLTGGSPYYDNLFEREAYREAP